MHIFHSQDHSIEEKVHQETRNTAQILTWRAWHYVLWTKARILLILFNLSGKWAGQGWGGMPGRGVFSDRSVRSVLGTGINKLNKYFMKTPSFSCDCAHSILHTVSICTIAHANWPRILAKHQLWPQCPAMGQHCTEHIKHYIGTSAGSQGWWCRIMTRLSSSPHSSIENTNETSLKEQIIPSSDSPIRYIAILWLG